MKIKAFIWQANNDFAAHMECEFCGRVERLTTGYNDNYYHTKVIPRMACPACKKSADGFYPQSDGSSDDMGRRSVA